jgi:hypothetical protein
MRNLNEGKKPRGYMNELAEIDAQSAIVAMEAKIEKLEEMAKAKEQRLEMVSEDENLSELISKSAVKEMQKEIKEIRKMQEKLKKVYEKKNGKKPVEVVDEEDKKMDEGNDPGEDTGVVPPDFIGNNYLDEGNNPGEDEMLKNLAIIAPSGDTGGKLVGKEKELLKMFQNMDNKELEQYKKVAAQEPDEITQADYFEFLDNVKNKTKKVSEEMNRWQKLAGL